MTKVVINKTDILRTRFSKNCTLLQIVSAMDNPPIRFELSKDQKSLLAVYDIPKDNELTINSNWLQEQLKQNGYDKLELLEEGIDKLINAFKQNQETSGSVCIAERKDATVSIIISRDKMNAYLTIEPAKGGKKVSLDQVKRALAEKGIRHGFIPEAIKSAILKGECEESLIAAGKPVENGEDAKFICLLPEIKIRTPQVAENGNVDYRDLGEILVVHPGDKLMRREPATQGKASKNIFGEVVMPRQGKDHKFAKGLEGVTTDPNDPNLLIAAETGQPIIVENGVKVENTMSVGDVNLSTGNIIFDGSVIITGDVENGMKVDATGDINVGGMVQSAELKAGGDIVVKGAIIGHGDVWDKNGNLNEETAKINAKGSITAKFTENAYLKAENNIFIQDWVIKSELYAVNEIIVGSKNAKKGQIIGGKVASDLLVKAMRIGSSSGVKTIVRAGKEVDANKELDKITSAIAKQNQALKELHKLMASLKNNPTKQAKEMLKKSLKTRQHMEEELIDLQARKSILKKEQKRAENVRVVVEQTVYSGSVIQLGKFEKAIKDDRGKRSFVLENGEFTQVSGKK